LISQKTPVLTQLMWSLRRIYLKPLWMKYLLLIIMLITILSCDNDEDCGVVYDEPFEIESGQSYCFQDDTELRVISISDSYCPCDVDCIWQGEAVVEAQLIDGSSVESFMIHEIMIEANPSFARISSIETTESCDPDISKIEIAIVR